MKNSTKILLTSALIVACCNLCRAKSFVIDVNYDGIADSVNLNSYSPIKGCPFSITFIDGKTKSRTYFNEKYSNRKSTQLYEEYLVRGDLNIKEKTIYQIFKLIYPSSNGVNAENSFLWNCYLDQNHNESESNLDYVEIVFQNRYCFNSFKSTKGNSDEIFIKDRILKDSSSFTVLHFWSSKLTLSEFECQKFGDSLSVYQKHGCTYVKHNENGFWVSLMPTYKFWADNKILSNNKVYENLLIIEQRGYLINYLQIVNLNNGKSLDIDIPGIESFGIEDNTLTVKVEGTETDVEQFDLNEIQESLF